MSGRTLSVEQAKRFYDRFGRRQDSQGFYEDAPLAALVAHADFASARSVYEFGCGTGRFAQQLLAEYLPQDAQYRGADVSSTMIDLASDRLSEFGDRARAEISNGEMRIDAPDKSFDRIVCTYVLDLLSLDDINAFLREAHRVLAPDGLLCVVGLTPGRHGVSRIVSRLWSAVHRLRPQWVGGCRPLEVKTMLPASDWSIQYDETVVSFGVPSEVLVARPRSV